MSDQPAILAEGLGKRFGEVLALEEVDLELPAGGVLALLGPNGAGKTTAVRILTTLLSPDAGWARVAGRELVREAGEVRRLIGLSGQYAAVDGYLTGGENLRMIGRLHGLSRRAARARAEELLERLGLHATADRLARTYSGGMRRRLDIAASLVAAPPVLFLDEPTTGLDPRGRFELWQLLEELTRDGASLLLTTQYLEEADRLADRIVVIDRGRVVAAGTSAELKAKVGGARLELHTLPGADPRRVAAALSGLGSGPAQIDEAARRVVLPVDGGPAMLPDLASRLAAPGLGVTELALRQPTLEDVFLALTGRPCRGDEAGGAACEAPEEAPLAAGRTS